LKTSEYRRFVRTLASPPTTIRSGLRQAFRTKRVANLSHGILGFKAETGELIHSMAPYLNGYQITPHMILHTKEELGDALYFLTLMSDSLKVRLPSFNKRIKSKDTILVLILSLDGIATEMLDIFKKTMYGSALNETKLADLLPKAVQTLYALCWSLYALTPDALVAQNVAKLKARYPEGAFKRDRAISRDLKQEAKAMKAVTAETPI
jgi:hypothetical protein